jgi:hypothetical protein
MILEATDKAIGSFLKGLCSVGDYYMDWHMPKINSGLFKTPWDKTAEIIGRHIEGTRCTCTVWEIE